MAIIKCPECGRQISDKAPACPHCGIQIAGKIIKCPQCGEVYFRDQEMCPICHHLTGAPSDRAIAQGMERQTTPTNADVKPQTRPSAPTTSQTPAPPIPPINEGDTPKKKGHGALIAGLIFAIIVVGVSFYFYHEAKTSKEQEAYGYAMKSNDPMVMQSYLDNNPDAPEEHLDSVRARLAAMENIDADWNNAIISGSKEALEDYLARHPDSEHRVEAQFKIDSIDWALAGRQNTPEALKQYLTQHPNGRYVEEANNALKTLEANTVQPTERQAVVAVLRKFFQSVNSRDVSGLESSVSAILTNFLGKAGATPEDVISFMNKIYKDNIENMNWRLGNDLKIDKKEVGDGVYEYGVQVSADQAVDKTDGSHTINHYRIKATVSPDSEISSMSMVRILQ